MKESSFLFKPVVYIALAIYITFTYFVLVMGNNAVAAMIPEDHFFEIVGAFSLFVTSLLFFYAFRMARKSPANTRISWVKQLLFLCLGVLFFVGAGEEISWGQRILGFQTPEPISEVNKQEEFNIHNLTAWETSKFLDADRLFDLFWFSFGVLVPGLAALAPSFRKFAERYIPIAFWGISLLFLYNYLWAKLAKAMFNAAYTFDKISLPQAIQEIKESNYAIIFILVGLSAIWDLTRP